MLARMGLVEGRMEGAKGISDSESEPCDGRVDSVRESAVEEGERDVHELEVVGDEKSESLTRRLS